MSSDDTSTRELFGPLPIADQDADRLDDLKDRIGDLDGCRVRATDYGKAELTVELEDVDEETEQARTEQINLEYQQLLERDTRWEHNQWIGVEERCPACGSGPGDASWQTAPGQQICPNGDCLVNTWGGAVSE